MRKFIHEAAGTSNGDADEDSFVPGDGDDLNDRIHFLPWERNPFDHQQRNHDFCNVMLDSYPYNGHTVAQDSLYGGVPIVTRSDGEDMCSRVSCLVAAAVVFDVIRVHSMLSHVVDGCVYTIGVDKCQYRFGIVRIFKCLRWAQTLRRPGD